MEAIGAQRLQLSTPTISWFGSEKLCKNPTRVSLRFEPVVSGSLQSMNVKNRRRSVAALDVSCSFKNDNPALTVEAESVDCSFILKKKSQEIEPYLNGRSIYLVGMMGSGKTTVGKIISDVLGYSFYDSDSLVEQAMEGTSVAEIFKLYGESFFRDNETEALKKLSEMHRLVVSTGGGAVVRPINWKYMHKGISVWLDVPLEALARRIAAVGTHSRPLLSHEQGDAFTNAFNRLSSLWEKRGEAYASASARVSLEHSAAKLGLADVCDLTPTMIAIEALEQIENYLEEESSKGSNGHFS